MYHGHSPEHLYLFFACNNKKFQPGRPVKNTYFFFILNAYIQCISYISIMSSELGLLKQCITELEAKNAKLEAEKAEIEARNAEL